MKKLFYYLLFSCLLIILFTGCSAKNKVSITNFEECAKAGNAIMESYPRQCRTADGQLFVEELSPAEQKKTTPPGEKELTDKFCGWSTKDRCTADNECLKGGCSGQVCHSKNNQSIFTTCEYRDCYNAEKYGVVCQCVDNECQWTKKD